MAPGPRLFSIISLSSISTAVRTGASALGKRRTFFWPDSHASVIAADSSFEYGSILLLSVASSTCQITSGTREAGPSTFGGSSSSPVAAAASCESDPAKVAESSSTRLASNWTSVADAATMEVPVAGVICATAVALLLACGFCGRYCRTSAWKPPPAPRCTYDVRRSSSLSSRASPESIRRFSVSCFAALASNFAIRFIAVSSCAACCSIFAKSSSGKATGVKPSRTFTLLVMVGRSSGSASDALDPACNRWIAFVLSGCSMA